MDVICELKKIADANNGYIAIDEAVEKGITREEMRKLAQEKELILISRDMYILNDKDRDEYLTVTMRFQWLIYSHETALYLHGILKEDAPKKTLTSLAGHLPMNSLWNECKIYYIRPDAYEYGKSTVLTPGGVEVPCYDPERALCDLARSRNRMAPSIFPNALKAYMASPKCNMDKLLADAKNLKVGSVFDIYLAKLEKEKEEQEKAKEETK